MARKAAPFPAPSSGERPGTWVQEILRAFAQKSMEASPGPTCPAATSTLKVSGGNPAARSRTSTAGPPMFNRAMSSKTDICGPEVKTESFQISERRWS